MCTYERIEYRSYTCHPAGNFQYLPFLVLSRK